MNIINLVGLFAGACFCAAAVVAAPPNVVIILTDDQGYADLGCFGGKHVKTPRIDRMAAEGAKLTSFYVAGSICTPSRAALMTGCYPKRIGMADRVLLAADKSGLNPNEVTIAELLKSAGYKTGLFGKWHLGDQPEFLPTRQGFDEFFGLPYSWDINPMHTRHHFPPLPLLEEETVVELEPDLDFLTARITDRAVDFIERHTRSTTSTSSGQASSGQEAKPFFLYLAEFLPHRPVHVAPPFMKDVPDAVKARLNQAKGSDFKVRDALYPQGISEIDWSVGRILDALKRNGLDENTLVVFTSDNGPMVGSCRPLSGGKGSTYEGGERVPAIVRWPGKIPAGQTIDEVVTAMDLFPTLGKLAGADLPADRVIDGNDIWPVLTENAASPHEAFFYYKGNALKAVRSGRWKLHLGKGKGKAPARRGPGASSPIMALYDLDADPGEQNNVLASHPEVAERLRSHAKDFEAGLKQTSRPAGVVANPKPLTTREN